jgi:5''-nucleotidase/2'',3''-cyclic phosphodiesterase and related esterases
MKHSIIRIGTWLLSVAFLFPGASCSRYFTPLQHTHTRHEIDSTIIADPAYVAHYAPYKARLESEMNRVVGRTEVSLTKPGNVPETLLGNFFADALLSEGRKLHPDAQLSFGTKGGLRTELPQGDITIGDLFELMPFENELVVLELPGSAIEQLAQFIAGTGGQPVSGMTMTIKDRGAEQIRIAGHPLDTASTYKLVTYDYLANGGDNLQALQQPVNRFNLGKKVREALIDYVSGHTSTGKPINTQIDGRIIRN